MSSWKKNTSHTLFLRSSVGTGKRKAEIFFVSREKKNIFACDFSFVMEEKKTKKYSREWR
jgi:hypothetical protein